MSQTSEAPDTRSGGAAPGWPPGLSLLIGQAASVVTVGATLAYVGGNLVLYLRSWFERFPWGVLLQDFTVTDVQSIGAAALVPAVFLAGLWTLLGYRRFHDWMAKNKTHRNWGVGGAIVVSALLVMATPFSIMWRSCAPQFHGAYREAIWCFVALAAVAIVFTAIGAAVLRPIDRLNSPSSKNLLVVLVTTLAILPAASGFVATIPFPPTTVCTTGGDRIEGVLVGTTTTGTYVGQFLPPPKDDADSPMANTGDRWVMTVPAAQVGSVMVGRGATTPCFRPPPAGGR